MVQAVPQQSLIESPTWQTLVAEAKKGAQPRIAQLLTEEPERLERFSVEAAGLRMDYSRHLLTGSQREQLCALAQPLLKPATEALFSGKEVNNTEHRPALHTALRARDNESAYSQVVQDTLQRMADFVAGVQDGRWQGHRGNTITDVINLGIGGSDLGPAMAYAALRPWHKVGLRCHFVSNVDPCHLSQTLAGLRAETTLFIIASKSFSTLETHENAQAARRWALAQGVPEDRLHQHFVAVSANVDKAREFGIAPDNVFPLWDWVGGRYSLWSAIGLPIALGTSMDCFQALLAGAREMDTHFREAPISENLPALMALLTLWYQQVYDCSTQVVLPYQQDLHLFPSYLQQLDMESLGKSVTLDGRPVPGDTGSILWGSAGTNGQHSFHQLLHQGTRLVPADFISAAQSQDDQTRHWHLLANCLAQSQALMNGKSAAQAFEGMRAQGVEEEEARFLAPHRAIPGNRPSTLIMMEALSPSTLGALISAYEHKVYCHSVLLGINAFDQWGVELGKVLSGRLHRLLTSSESTADQDPSTQALIHYCRQHGAQKR